MVESADGLEQCQRIRWPRAPHGDRGGGARLSVGVPSTGFARPRAQMSAPVAGFSRRTEPRNWVAPIVVVVAATNSREPSQRGAVRQALWPDAVPTATCRCQTGPAAMLFCRRAYSRPFLLQAPTMATAAPLIVAVNRVGDPPKSASGVRSLAGIRHPASRAIVAPS